MTYETVLYEVQDRVAWVTLNRPEEGNALNEQMHQELHDVWRRFNQDDDAWVAVLMGAGADFCLGEDAEEIAAAYAGGGKVSRWEQDERWQRKLTAGLEPTFGWPEPTQGLPGKPLIAAVHGRCQGAGLMLVAHADFAIAAQGAEFSLPNVDQGTVPIHEAIVLARTMLRPAVMRLALLGRHERWDGERARKLGLVIEAVEDDLLKSRAEEIATVLTTKVSPLAVRASRRAWWLTFDSPLHHTGGENQILHNVLGNEVRVTSLDAKEGPRAFAEKRPPNWIAG